MNFQLTKYRYFIVILVTATTVYILQILGVSLPKIINNYLNDFLLIPIALNSCLLILRYVKSDSQLQLPLAFCLVVTFGYSLFFEVLIPDTNPRYTADLWDIGAYFLGLAFYLFAENYTSISNNKTGSSNEN